ncbi:TadE/TadG family type IV pilus assembly protein [Gellertiella hungarica]|uniref:Flp pilus assembly protein TadG n=1 Tax=Gellertiella hungarica TaxID=1572859 RepID=A0A7W6J8Y2_9HYPH|nr:TadE/TadG family type IV pilus assembly protein [Gellertiella hungarica]MBB4066927.1 Flp pilus assembly protein TadG [Gellertiella hungarica]
MAVNHVRNAVHGLLKARGGNFAMTTAMLCFPLIALAGLSVDLWNAYETKTKLDQVADSAALAAINTSSKAFANSSSGQGKASWDSEAQAFFTGNKAAIDPRLSVSVTADVQRNGLTLTSLVHYQTSMPTMFMGLVGVEHMDISGTATAEFNVGEYYNVHVLVDNSPSMGIGASQSDVDVMQAKMGCAFACHDLSGSMNNLPKATSLGVKLRIDVVSMSLRKLADMISTNVGQKGLYQLALYSLGAKAEDAVARPLSLVQSLTHDMAAFKTSAQGVKLMIMPKYNYNNYAVGYINQSIQMINKEIPVSGDGLGVNSPRQVLLLITDGVEDRLTTASGCFGIFQYGRCTQYINVSECQKLKNRGVLIAVLHTIYLPITTNDNYINWVRAFAPKIGPALESCASPNLYEAVDMNSDMSVGLNQLFKRATNMPRLTF